MDALSPTLTESAASSSLALDSLEQPFIGRWNKLVSTTNWQKGEIIQQWREALIAAGAPSAEFSDEAWSQRVGGVTPQHVGRLRRVFQRFGSAHGKFENLYWSHFQAALDWDDAEMWLEGAVQSDWSVADMRRTRQETLGPASSESEINDAAVETETGEEDYDSTPDLRRGDLHVAEDGSRLVPEGPDFGDEDAAAEPGPDSWDETSTEGVSEPAALVRPFESLAAFPSDFGDAFESMKLAILRHKNEGWSQMGLDDVISALNALKEMALAPSDLPA